MDVVEALLPCFLIEMQPKYFRQFSILKKYFIPQNINQSMSVILILDIGLFFSNVQKP
jgi:hypothetical protein